MKRPIFGDSWTWLLGVAVTVVGVLAIWDSGYTRSASLGGIVPREVVSQSLAALVAMGLAFAAGLLPSDVWRRLAWPAYLAGLAGLVAVKVVGKEINGAQRWIEVGAFNFQPSEFTKLAIVLLLAAAFASRPASPSAPRRALSLPESLDRVWIPRLLRAWPLIPIVAYVLMIESEPDLATAMVVAAVSGIVVVLGGASAGSLSAFAVVGAAAVAFLVGGQSYRIDRIANHGDRWSETNVDSIGYQTTQSEAAMARGGLLGVGFGQGKVKHTLPAPTTDFVMTTVAEETGLVGTLAVFGLLAGLAGRIFALARSAADRFGRLVCWGTAVWIGIQSCTNLMMANGFLPPIGVPMPFVSAGGSSLIAIWLAIGVCHSALGPPLRLAPIPEDAREAHRDRGRDGRPRVSRA